MRERQVLGQIAPEGDDEAIVGRFGLLHDLLHFARDVVQPQHQVLERAVVVLRQGQVHGHCDEGQRPAVLGDAHPVFPAGAVKVRDRTALLPRLDRVDQLPTPRGVTLFYQAHPK
ncbi:hypothetical protein D3C71_1873590 [compost metagenome]